MEIAILIFTIFLQLKNEKIIAPIKRILSQKPVEYDEQQESIEEVEKLMPCRQNEINTRKEETSCQYSLINLSGSISTLPPYVTPASDGETPSTVPYDANSGDVELYVAISNNNDDDDGYCEKPDINDEA